MEKTSFYNSEKVPKIGKKEVLDLVMDNIKNDVEIDTEINTKPSKTTKITQKKLHQQIPQTRSSKQRGNYEGKSSIKKRELKNLK